MMATFQQIPEEGRPPDSPNKKYFNRKLRSATPKSTWHNKSYRNSTSVTLSNKNLSEFNNNLLEIKPTLVRDFNRNVQSLNKIEKADKIEKSSLKQSLPKLLCLKKSANVSADKTDKNTLKTLNVKDLTAENFVWNELYSGSASKRLNVPNSNIDASNATSSHGDKCLTNRSRNRESFHQNVEEALNSLLWQPYEYQHTTRTTSISSSSCTTPSSSFDDLDEITKNDGTSPHCSFTDLHLLTSTSEMVINLPTENLTDQSTRLIQSRDEHTLRSNSCLGDVFSLTEVARQRVTCDKFRLSDANSGDMQVNVSLSSSNVPQTSVLNISTAENGLRNNVTIQNQQNVFSNSLNLSSANVVGLPSHTRYASVPVSTIQSRPTGNSTVLPNHARNISEPSNQFRYQNCNGLQQLQPVNVALNHHHRHSAQVDNNFHQINHLRSSSVPKSLPIVPRHESTTTTTTTTVPNSHINNTTRFIQKPNQQLDTNVSNINVNFYRAVPVNVVSSVPTIQCFNTLSNIQGNEVSNVQVLPLSSNCQPHTSNQLPVNSTTQNNNSNIGTTQVILHNVQSTSNSIQIPNSNGNNRNTFPDSQILSTVPTQFNKITNVTASNAITNCLPPPLATSLSNPVVIQNNRSINNMVPSVHSQQNSGTKMYTNAIVNSVQVSSNTQGLNQNRLNNNNNESRPPRTDTRTFTSTEAQTDDISVIPATSSDATNREIRRRERRERRHQRRVNSGIHRHSVTENSTQVNNLNLHNDRLPDLLHSHLPPPYSTLPNAGPPPPPPQSVISPVPPQIVPPQMLAPPHGAVLQTVIPSNIVPPSGFVFPPPPPVISGQVPLVQGPTPVAVTVPPPSGFRFPFPTNGFRRGRFSEDSPKGCCGILSWKPGSLRWFIALIALVAVCCVLVGTALGAMRPAGRDHLTVSLLMIGVGIVLVTVSAVAWRLTSHSATTCRSMLGLSTSTESVDACARRFVPRLPPSYGRPHHPYAAMMYPEFQYRPPPPSYQASMQEYRLRLLLLDRGNTPQIQAGIQNAVSPPPTYRSHAGSLLRAPLSSRRDASQSEYSCPPSYRSQNSTNRQGTLQSNSVLHSREQSLSLSESNHGGSVVNVVNILGSTAEDIALDNITLDSLKMEPESDINPVKMLLKSSSSDLEGSKDGNLVTIVQTSDQSPVIVTVSGSSQIDNNCSVQITEIPSEMEILAHL